MWFLLITSIIIFVCIDSECIKSHRNYTIDFILANIEHSSISNLGHKYSSVHCQNSCQHLNYLCDKDASDILKAAISVSINNADCTITLDSQTDGTVPYVAITSNFVSNHYRIDAEITAKSGNNDAGIYFKSNNDRSNSDSDYQEYWFAMNPEDGFVTGRSIGTSYTELSRSQLSGTEFNTRYNISVYVNSNQFTTYARGTEEHYSGSLLVDFKDNYAGIWNYHTNAIFHSFRVSIFDGPNTMFCAAYIYHKSSGDCYGFYGVDYTEIEVTLKSDINYDSGIIYADECPILAPTEAAKSSSTADTTSSSTADTTSSSTAALTSIATIIKSTEPVLMHTAATTLIRILSTALTPNTTTLYMQSTFTKDTNDAASQVILVQLMVTGSVIVVVMCFAICSCCIYMRFLTGKNVHQNVDMTEIKQHNDANKAVDNDNDNLMVTCEGPRNIVNILGRENIVTSNENTHNNQESNENNKAYTTTTGNVYNLAQILKGSIKVTKGTNNSNYGEERDEEYDQSNKTYETTRNPNHVLNVGQIMQGSVKVTKGTNK